MATDIQSIALFRLSALGDVLMFVPTVRALQNSFPKANLTWIISKPAYELVRHIQNIEFIVIDKPKSFKDYISLRALFKAYRFDVLLAAQACWRTNFIFPLIPAKRKIGYDSVRGRDMQLFFVNERIAFKTIHTLQGFMQFAEHLGADVSEVVWNLPLEQDAVQWVEGFISQHILNSRPLVLINPAASRVERTWTVEGYIEIIHYLQQAFHAKVVLCGGPSVFEQNLAKQILAHVEAINLVGKTKLPQLLALVDAADLLICPDTGPSHMAAALNTPVIALHAVTRPEISGPYGQLKSVVNAYPEVIKLIKATGKKQKSKSKDWFRKARHPDAMRLVKTDDVKRKILEILS